MIWVHSVGQVPLAFLMMTAAFKSMDPSLEESAMMSGANTWKTFERVTLQLLMPTAGSVVLILFVRTLESFETPALIGIPARIYVYTSEIFSLSMNIRRITGAAGRLPWACYLLSAIGVWLCTRSTRENKKFEPSQARRSDRDNLTWGRGVGSGWPSSWSISCSWYCCLFSYCFGLPFSHSLRHRAGTPCRN